MVERWMNRIARIFPIQNPAGLRLSDESKRCSIARAEGSWNRFVMQIRVSVPPCVGNRPGTLGHCRSQSNKSGLIVIVGKVLHQYRILERSRGVMIDERRLDDRVE